MVLRWQISLTNHPNQESHQTLIRICIDLVQVVVVVLDSKLSKSFTRSPNFGTRGKYCFTLLLRKKMNLLKKLLK